MKDGFIKVAAGIPQITLADTSANAEEIKKLILKAEKEKVNLLVLPELCVTGATCGDLFFNETLITNAKAELLKLTRFTEGKSVISIIGLPLEYESKLYNCAAVLFNGKILGIVPKVICANTPEKIQIRHFNATSELSENCPFQIGEYSVKFGKDLVFKHDILKDFSFCIQIGDVTSSSLFGQNPAINKADIIVNPCAFPQTVGKTEKIENFAIFTSSRLKCGYLSVCAGLGESTTDGVYSGYSIIAENGKILAENPPFSDNDLIVSEIGTENLAKEGNKTITPDDQFINEATKACETQKIERNPFLPSNTDLNRRAEEILEIQSHALARRLSHTHAKTAVIGISGGLDSTLALLAAARSMKILSRPMTDIIAITMPCFGTTKRTRSNSEILCNELGVTFREINISAAVKQHFKDINHDENSFDVTYENAQARERTQVLMDVANKENGLVIGTGDLSELALGWATYNGDHMSMYGVNSDIPKTLIRHLVKYEADHSEEALKKVLYDILDTPVSPELLPADDKGDIAQKTEDLVGPYELHDFFLYHTVRYGENPAKIFSLAVRAFPEYNKATIKHWLLTFTRRFFNQQFKRSCLPDGPKVGSVALSPRGSWQMPSDALSNLWLKEIEKIEV